MGTARVMEVGLPDIDQTQIEHSAGNASGATYPSQVEPHPPYWDLATRAVFALLMAVVMILAIVGNVMVILVILNNRGMRTRTNIFLCNLAVADLACAVFDMPVTMVTMAAGRWVFSETVCQLNGFATPLFLITSIHTLMYMSVHKYISIRRPFSHGLRRRWIYAMVAGAWSWSALAGFTSLYGLNSVSYKPYTVQCGPSFPYDARTYMHFGLVMASCFCLPFGVMVFCYANVFREMRSHSRRMQLNSTLEKDAILSQQKRITWTLFLVLLMFVICWLPYNIYALYVAIVDDKTRTPIRLNPFSYLFGYINSAVNPVLYALRSPAFREGYKQIVCVLPKSNYREYRTDSLWRRMSSIRQYFSTGLPFTLQDVDAGSGSTSRKNSLSHFVSAVLFSRPRAFSTISLPQRSPNALAVDISHLRERQTPGNLQAGFHIGQCLEAIRSKDDISADDDRAAVPDGGYRSSLPDHVLTYSHNRLSEVSDDGVIWEDDVGESRLPVAYVAQVSVTPSPTYHLAGHTSADCEIQISLEGDSPGIDASLKTNSSPQHHLLNPGGRMETINAVSGSMGGFLQNLIRKASNKRALFAKSEKRKQDDTPPRIKRPSTAMHLDKMVAGSGQRQTTYRSLSQSKSEPFLEEGRHHLEKVKQSSREGSKKQKDSRMPSGKRANELKRYPSVETLDSRPASTSIHGKITKLLKHQKQMSKVSTAVVLSQSPQPACFLRENKHGKISEQHQKVARNPEDNNNASRLRRSLSDPCLTFKMIEQKVLIISEVTKSAKRQIQFTRHHEENVGSEPGRVDFIVGDVCDDHSEIL